jgi:VanZ family protein
LATSLKKLNFRRLISLWLPVLGWAGLIFYLSSLPSPPPSGIPFFDVVLPYLAHLGIYLILTVLLYRATQNYRLVFLIGVLYGLSDEWHQAFVPTRTPSVWDWLVDVLGLILALLLISQLLPRLPKTIRLWAKKLAIEP